MDIDIETIREMSGHAFCAPDLAPTLTKNLQSKFKGRILPSDDSNALNLIQQLDKLFHEEIKVYDVSHTFDRIKATKNRVFKTPTLIMKGKKYEGIKEILNLITSSQKQTTKSTNQ
jgi:hypothetical protein